jgi:hypothetical protein
VKALVATKKPLDQVERAGNYRTILPPKRLDILRERVEIGGAITVGSTLGVHLSNVPSAA